MCLFGRWQHVQHARECSVVFGRWLFLSHLNSNFLEYVFGRRRRCCCYVASTQCCCTHNVVPMCVCVCMCMHVFPAVFLTAFWLICFDIGVHYLACCLWQIWPKCEPEPWVVWLKRCWQSKEDAIRWRMWRVWTTVCTLRATNMHANNALRFRRRRRREGESENGFLDLLMFLILWLFGIYGTNALLLVFIVFFFSASATS